MLLLRKSFILPRLAIVFLSSFKEKSEEMKLAEKVQKLGEEESKLHKMQTEVGDELDSICHQSQQEERVVVVVHLFHNTFVFCCR